MNPRVAELFAEAIEIDAAERAAWLVAASGGDETLLTEVELLLRADAKADRFLQTPPEIGAVRNREFSEQPTPTAFGPFRVERSIGKGGMGEVWLATRQDGEFEQRVAIKQVSYPTPGLLLRFRSERQILARLDHPNIARLMDGGVDASGAPWLAMEYVKGEPITDHVRQHDLDPHASVRLFVQVCESVQYAHQNLVVHRDLKPSNILVGADGAPKLLDFGIAKVLAVGDEEQTPTIAAMLTPEYAAPEQWRGAAITTATDVYSLGVVLYELLCGRRPRNDAREPAQGAVVDSVRPSAAVPRNNPANRARARVLAGDLDHIVMHALETDPAQRYPSAAALREDLERWLEHRPLTIARPRPGYVASRFVKRHRFGVAASTIALLALLGSSGYAFWQAQRADRFAERAEHSKSFLLDLFAKANPYDTRSTHKDARDLLRDAAQHIDSEFADAPETQVELREAIANVLVRIGDPTASRDLLQRNIGQLRQLHGADAPQVGVELASLALAEEVGGDIDGARAHFAESWDILRNAGDTYQTQRISAMTGLAKMANRRGDHAEAQRVHEAVLKERVAKEGPQSPDIAMDLMNLAADALYVQNYSQAVALAQRAHAMIEHTLGLHHPRSIYVDQVLGLAQTGVAGQIDAGIVTLTGAVDLARKTLPPNTEELGIVTSALAYAHYVAGNDDTSIALLEQAQAILQASKSSSLISNEVMLGLVELRSHRASALATLRDARARIATTHSNNPEMSALADAAYGAALAASGDTISGEALTRKARNSMLTGGSAGRNELANVDCLLADILDRKGNAAEARTLRQQALVIYQRTYGKGHPIEHRLAMQLLATTAPVR